MRNVDKIKALEAELRHERDRHANTRGMLNTLTAAFKGAEVGYMSAMALLETMVHAYQATINQLQKQDAEILAEEFGGTAKIAAETVKVYHEKRAELKLPAAVNIKKV